MTAWRITRTRHPPYDGTGAHDWGGRWNSRGRRVIYGADSFAGAILEILAHTLKPRTVGLNLMINPEHPDAARIRISEPFAVPWGERLF